jgi:hypothetical protein
VESRGNLDEECVRAEEKKPHGLIPPPAVRRHLRAVRRCLQSASGFKAHSDNEHGSGSEQVDGDSRGNTMLRFSTPAAASKSEISAVA